MPISCSPTLCGCSFVSNTIAITQVGSTVQLEMAGDSVITDLQAAVDALEADLAALDASTDSALTTLSSGLAVLQAAVPLASTAYTPVFTASGSNPNLGSTGTATGYYTQVGKLVYAQFVLAFGGSGISSGTGTYAIALPVSPQGHTSSSIINHGTASITDSGVGTKNVGYTIAGTIRPINLTSFAAITNFTAATIGVTFAAGDSIAGSITYLAA